MHPIATERVINTEIPARTPLSVVVITKNAAHQLAPCLKSAAFADELLVVDSGSEDATVSLAQEMGARVLHQPWLGFGPQKQFAVEQAQYDWVLCLDADERLSPELAGAICRALALGGGEYSAWRFPRCNRFMGRYLRYGEGYPDWSLRLFDRRHARWSFDPVHEKVVLAPGVRCGTLPGDLLHDSAETLEAYLVKQNRYTSLAARQAGASGKTVSVWRLFLSPLLRFFKFYLVRQGFRDGLPGLVHIGIGCFNSFIKYAKLRELGAEAHSGPDREPAPPV